MNNLPPSAAAKLAEIEQSIADADALVASVMHKQDVMEGQLADLMRRSHVCSTQELEALKPQIAELDAKVEASKLEQQRRQERSVNDKQLLARLRQWLRENPFKVVMAQPAKVNAKSLDEVANGISQCRETITNLKKERHGLKFQALPRDELSARAKAYVQELAASAKPKLLGISGEEPFGFDRHSVPSGLALLAWLDPERLIARIESMLPSDQDGAASKDRLASIEQALLDAERLEEALIVKALEQGQHVLRRPRADPRAVLGVQIATGTAKAA